MLTTQTSAPTFWGGEGSSAETPLREVGSGLRHSDWERIEEALRHAYSIAFDGCHQVYLFGNEYLHRLVGENYDLVCICHTDEGIDRAMEQIQEWFARACPSRFIKGAEDTSHLVWDECKGPTVCSKPTIGARLLIEQWEHLL